MASGHPNRSPPRAFRRQSSEIEDEVSLYSNARERRQWDKLAEFFAIIKTTEHLENARIKSAVGRDEVGCRTLSNRSRFSSAPLSSSRSMLDVATILITIGRSLRASGGRDTRGVQIRRGNAKTLRLQYEAMKKTIRVNSYMIAVKRRAVHGMEEFRARHHRRFLVNDWCHPRSRVARWRFR
ncbi:unnamed protein product [Scytosiphon promiscuus]